MAYEMKNNSGSLFINNRKEKPNHPDRTGKAMVGGIEFYVSGWLKETKNGEKWLSLSFKPVDEQQPQGGSSQQVGSDDSGDVPF